MLPVGLHFKVLIILSDLCDQQIAANNFAEAGSTLLLHANLLDWSDTPIDPMGPFPKTEPAWERKVRIAHCCRNSILRLAFIQERLYLSVIDYFDKGKQWENAIELLELMRQQYQHVLFDYAKLSTLLVCASFNQLYSN